MRGTAIVMNRSRNSYIRAPRSVTLQPTAIPSRRLKFAIAFLARVTTGCWPVMAASSATAASSPLGFLVASPMPTLSTIFTSFGIWCAFFRPNCCANFGRTFCSYHSGSRGGGAGSGGGPWASGLGAGASGAFLPFFSFFWPFGACCACSAPRGSAAGSGAPACFGSRSFVSAMALLRSHTRNRLAGLNRDPLRRSIFVQAPPHPRRLSRLGVEQHHFRRRQRRRQLDDAALLVGRGGALVLLHDVHTLHHHAELLGVHAQHLSLFPPMLTRDHPHRVALGDVQLVALRLPGPRPAAALLEYERLHVRSPLARARRYS